MKRILLPTDFSNNSWNAINYALQLFKKEVCEFIVLNTFTPIIYKWEYLQSGSADLEVFDAMRKASEKGLEGMLKRIETEFPNPKHRFTARSAFNTLTSEIEQVAEEQLLDMIVMGTQGASGLERVLFGSNTIHVLKSAHCPILAVPSGFVFKEPHAILFPSDLKIDFQAKHVQPILDLAASFAVKIHLLHVFEGEELTEQQFRNKEKLEDYLKKHTVLYHEMFEQNITEAIAEFEMTTPIDLLVLVNNKHSFFTNLFFTPVIHHIGFHLNLPLLVIPAKP